MNTPDCDPIALPPVMLSEADRDRLYAIAIAALTNSRVASSASNVLREISRAKIVPDDELPKNVVAVNSHVDVRDNVTGTARQVVLVMPDENVDTTERGFGIESPGSSLDRIVGRPLGRLVFSKRRAEQRDCPPVDSEFGKIVSPCRSACIAQSVQFMKGSVPCDTIAASHGRA
ncbi:hypothetical protein SAMN05216338_1005107 [Bradyrhizobium sp. Rc2d]|uniref:hypothetical protein n=1 Tax=Bradyrhizobium sp. Rc2d TaxID=1855321 RepID=UPI000890407B|nr:hypothetical protein [Bradyrhizobium sp. Rc2d]SDH08923.1 hypothetical protein SAMN05216338_1005107 [Bradyrhizobium sp. Rc2d]